MNQTLDNLEIQHIVFKWNKTACFRLDRIEKYDFYCTFFTTVCFISSSKVCLFSELVNLKKEKAIKVAKNIHLSVNIIVSECRLNPSVFVPGLNQNTKTKAF